MPALRMVTEEEEPTRLPPQPYRQLYFPALAGWCLTVSTGCARPSPSRHRRRHRDMLLSLSLLEYRARVPDSIPRPYVPPRTGPGPKSIGMKPLTRRERRKLQKDESSLRRSGKLGPRPKRWQDCEGFDGPCPLLGCRHHMGSDITRIGALKLTWPGRSPEEMPGTCNLRLAEDAPDDGWSHEEIGRFNNLTHERVRQVEETARNKILVLAPHLAVLFDRDR